MMAEKGFTASSNIHHPMEALEGWQDIQDRPSVIDEEASSDEEFTPSQFSEKQSTGSAAVVDVTRAETAAVNRSKLLVYMALIVAAAAVGTVTYILTSNAETNNYESDFRNYAREIARLTDSNVKAIIGQVQGLSVMTTSIGLSNNLTWPYVSVPHFARRTQEAEELAGIELLVFAPIVALDQELDWSRYAWDHQHWIQDDLAIMGEQDLQTGNITKQLYSFSKDGMQDDMGQYSTQMNASFAVPVWQLGPVPKNASIINLNLNSIPSFQTAIYDAISTRKVMLSEVVDLTFLLKNTLLEHALDNHPRSFILEPVFETFSKDSSVGGFFVADLQWHKFLMDLLPDTTGGIVIVVRGSCGDVFSYLINGRSASFQNATDIHNSKFNNMEETFAFAAFVRDTNDTQTCRYSLSLYPTNEFVSPYRSNQPAVYTSVVVLIFCFTAAVFALYDYFVYVRQTKLHATAKRTNEIVASMFPKDFQQRVMEDVSAKAKKASMKEAGTSFLNDEQAAKSDDDVFKTKTIADLFSEVSILFADIVGFTAWSCMREPSEVFTLLETIFHEYDVIAAHRKVFKVETVGDCYVAAVGVPDPRKNHAVVMARFARDCLHQFSVVSKHLENTLGPETSDLGMRFGLHTGTVTAGVLRGERARFQLFGDTMNTTARIEATGAKNKIHISQEMAEALARQGKGHWCVPREDKVVAKGKGELTTFWLELRGESTKSSQSGSSSECEKASGIEIDITDRDVSLVQLSESNQIPSTSPILSKKNERLVNWNTEILLRTLREMVAHRKQHGTKSDTAAVRRLENGLLRNNGIVLDEVTDVILFPMDGLADVDAPVESSHAEISTDVARQLREYVTTIANMYRDNSYHNFEHASHVTMSAVKLLSRIVSPGAKGVEASHDHTFGITSNPLTQFAILFCALTHDVDHTGVPNAQLAKEQVTAAAAYKNKSIAEQNSLDIAWELLMQDQFEDLRRVIYVNVEEAQHFRQVLVNAVMATDLMDNEHGIARKDRWNRAFPESTGPVAESDSNNAMKNRQATVVMEHLVQASDIAHMMQHWQVYQKWNERLFQEMYKAYQDGRAEKDPSENWYCGEIAFFDFCVIPLAKKLQESGVLGVSSYEYLKYAEQNRKEWESKGHQLVEEMLQALKQE